MTEVTAVRAFRDNYIWVLTASTTSSRDVQPAPCVVVDPGDAEPVLDLFRDANLKPVAILITHHHGDHTGGIAALLRPDAIPVYGPASEYIPGITHPLKEGDWVDLPNNFGKFSVLDVPGHTAGHIAYFSDNLLFCGDTLFGAGCGRLFEGTPAQMLNSLNKLAHLPTPTHIYCAHEYTLSNLEFAAAVEPDNVRIAQRRARAQAAIARGEATVPSTLAEELATNPFLRCQQSTVRQSAQVHAGKALADTLEVFTVIRQWKDQW